MNFENMSDQKRLVKYSIMQLYFQLSRWVYDSSVHHEQIKKNKREI